MLPVYEDFKDPRNGEDGAQANSALKAICDYAEKLKNLITKEADLPAWVQGKLAVIQHDIDEVFHALDGMDDSTEDQLYSDDQPENSNPDDAVRFDIEFNTDAESDEAPGELDFKSFDEFSDKDDEETPAEEETEVPAE